MHKLEKEIITEACEIILRALRETPIQCKVMKDQTRLINSIANKEIVKRRKTE